MSAWIRTDDLTETRYLLSAEGESPEQASRRLRILKRVIKSDAFIVDPKTHPEKGKSPDTNIRSLGASTNIPKDRWLHVVTTYKPQSDGNVSLWLYIDGELRSSNTYRHPVGSAVTAKNLTVGGSPLVGEGEGATVFSGEIDDVILLSRTLSPEQVRDLYQLSRPRDHVPWQPDKRKEAQ